VAAGELVESLQQEGKAAFIKVGGQQLVTGA
jgi:hypothetical protein